MIEKLCSGGQTGADLGGLLAAEELKIPTYGFLPPGCITEDGPRYEYLARFGMIEAEYGGYVWRTEMNVKNSDGTMRFFTNPLSAGEKATKRAINLYSKPYFDVNLNSPKEIEEAIQWIRDNSIKALNVAGHRESRCPGIQRFTKGYLVAVLGEKTHNSGS